MKLFWLIKLFVYFSVCTTEYTASPIYISRLGNCMFTSFFKMSGYSYFVQFLEDKLVMILLDNTHIVK